MPSRRSAPALFACLCFASFWGGAPRQYTPVWKDGDWWVTKVWQQLEKGGSLWHLERYDVDGSARVETSDCFVLKKRLQSYRGTVMQVGSDYYVRKSDWRVVRRVTFRSAIAADTSNYPLGLSGAVGEPRLPHFPLRLRARPDTTFRPRERSDSSVLVREFARAAGPALVKRVLDEGDTTEPHVFRPTGKVYEARSEFKSDSAPGTERITRSLQLWCNEQPWRLYEEFTEYDSLQPGRTVMERTWLVASGHAAR